MAEAKDDLMNPICEAADLNDVINGNEAYEDRIAWSEDECASYSTR